MINEIANKYANLPASIVNLQGLAQSVTSVGVGGGGEQYMKMTRFGEFVFGAEQLEIEEDSIWAVNPTQFTHGWICWGTKEHGTDGEMLGELMTLASNPLPDEASLPVAKGKWTKQVGVQLRCLKGADEDVQCIFKTNSLGGKKAYASLVSAVVTEVQDGSEFVCPVVNMNSSHYTHKTYGKIFTPEFEIVDWMSMEGLSGEEKAEPEPEPEKPKRAKRKTAVKKVTVVPEVEAEAGKEQEEKPVRRRRRRRS